MMPATSGVPDSLTYCFRDDQEPFGVLTDLEHEYAYKIRIPLTAFSRDDVCFTYPDSLYEVLLDDLCRLCLKRNIRPTIYTLDELARVISTHGVYEIRNHYGEAQIWNDRPPER